MKKTIIQTSPYEKKQIVKNSQHISVSDYREVSLDDILKKITNEIEKRKKIAEETIAFFIKVAEKYEMKNTIKKLSSMSSYIIQNGKIEGYKD